jgi:membrane protein involved in colicin uptake
MDESGAIPLVVMAAAKIAKKADPEKKAARKAKREKKRTERRARREARKAAGQPGLWDQILSLFSGKKAEAEPVPAQTSGLEYVGQDELGAILIDTDGRRVDTERW